LNKLPPRLRVINLLYIISTFYMFINMQRHRWPPNPCLLVAGLLLATCSTVQVVTDFRHCFNQRVS
jgi:hypothetical protein